MTLAETRHPPLVREMLARTTNPELEQQILGLVIGQPASFNHTISRLSAGDFSDPAHAAIFDAIAARQAAGQAVNAAALREVALALDAELSALGGGMAYVAELGRCRRRNTGP